MTSMFVRITNEKLFYGVRIVKCLHISFFLSNMVKFVMRPHVR
jgi:hypothetical protein